MRYIEPEDGDCGCILIPDQVDEGIARWDWLIKNWGKMTFLERMSIFLPYMKHVTLRDCHISDFTDELNQIILQNSFELCRNHYKIHFQIDGQGAPTIILEYKPVNIQQIPDVDIRTSVINWGRTYGFIE